MKKAKEAKEAEAAKAELERKMKKEIRTGGGFNIEKLKELRAQGMNIWTDILQYLSLTNDWLF